jgi:hypothetical protein
MKKLQKRDFDRNEKKSTLKPPRGYDKEHPAIELLKLKKFESSVQFDISEILQNDFVSK